MAILLTGLQGSGKSYYAMHKMYNEREKFYRIYTNIDGLKSTDKIHSLNFNKFVDDIVIPCYDLVVKEDKSFETAIEFLQDENFLPENVSKNNRIMVVIDEAQNHFAKKNQYLSWLITQHRHLYLELILITQKFSLLHTDYYLFNLVYDAVPPVKQFNKNSISYKEYTGLPISDTNFVRKFSIKKDQAIFAMYVSGDAVDSPFVLKRFIFMGVGVLFFAVMSLYFLVDYLSPKEKVVEELTKDMEIKKRVEYIDDDIAEKYEGFTYIKLSCVDKMCTNKMLHINMNINDLNSTIINSGSKFLSVNDKGLFFSSVFILASKSFINLFQGANDGNKKKKTTDSKSFIPLH